MTNPGGRSLREIFLAILRPGSVRAKRIFRLPQMAQNAISVLVRLLRLRTVTLGYETAQFRKTRTSTEIALCQVGRTRPGRTLPGRKMTKKISRSDLPPGFVTLMEI